MLKGYFGMNKILMGCIGLRDWNKIKNLFK